MASQRFFSIAVLAVIGVSCIGASPDSAAPRNVEQRVTFDRTCKCGQKATSRIVGGETAGVNEWPWQAAIMYGSDQFCGGSLINDRYVLTAAHCTYDFVAKELSVRLGEHILSNSSETEVVTRKVAKIIEHPYYKPGDEINDIALLKLSSPVAISETVLPVCMPPKKPRYAGKTAVVTGWGHTESGGTASDTLLEVSVKVLSQVECRRGNYGSAIKGTMLCAGSAGKDSCQGDSGGPLVFKDRAGNYDQIGVVSWGIGCGDEGYPGVYTRVNKYLEWIKSNTADGVYCKGMTL
ncbi:trypsin alpha-3-like [Penaeus japonicus]|uniref:trypsin alpha-3-like n=1 Tax=Penaeus japonicus TaxID=27405 RepID=UPI001C716EE5|nr:trypsin alpha-3-like [Penaeus japonicus]